MKIHCIIYAPPPHRLLLKTLKHGPWRNATFSGFKIWLFLVSGDIFWVTEWHFLQPGKTKGEKTSVLSQHNKEKQIALKHESSALNYSPLLSSNKKGGSIFLDPRTTNQLQFFLLGAQKLGSREASAPLRISSHPTFVIMSLNLLLP